MGTMLTMSDAIVDRGEIEEMMWALADIRVDVIAIRQYLWGKMKKKRKNLKMTPEEWAAWKARAERQARMLRESATRRPGARERLEGRD